MVRPIRYYCINIVWGKYKLNGKLMKNRVLRPRAGTDFLMKMHYGEVVDLAIPH